VFQYNGYAGNPDLEPMRSWQYDIAAEWYISPTNSLTGAIFYKQLEGFMETSLNSTVDYTNNGQTRAVRVLRPENQGNGYVQGFEAAYNGDRRRLAGATIAEHKHATDGRLDRGDQESLLHLLLADDRRERKRDAHAGGRSTRLGGAAGGLAVERLPLLVLASPASSRCWLVLSIRLPCPA
jgi:hypothetical protein